jgi:hypothetical protein
MEAFLKFTVTILVVYVIYYAFMIVLEKLKLSKSNGIDGGKLMYTVQAEEPVMVRPNIQEAGSVVQSQNKHPPVATENAGTSIDSVLYDLGLETIDVTGFGIPVVSENLFHHIQ